MREIAIHLGMSKWSHPDDIYRRVVQLKWNNRKLRRGLAAERIRRMHPKLKELAEKHRVPAHIVWELLTRDEMAAAMKQNSKPSGELIDGEVLLKSLRAEAERQQAWADGLYCNLR